MNARASFVIAVIALSVLAVGCKKTVKGEETRWKRANQTVDELVVLYPGFKTALEAQRTEAKALYDAAQKIEDKKQRISKLSSANATLDGGFVAELAGVEAKIKALRGHLVDITGSAKAAGEEARITQAKAEADRTLTEVAARLKTGAATPAEARVIVKKIVGDIDAADQLLARAAPRPTATASDGGAAAGTAAPATAPPAAPEQWTCEFCDHKNEAGRDSCANCGAPRSKK